MLKMALLDGVEVERRRGVLKAVVVEKHVSDWSTSVMEVAAAFFLSDGYAGVSLASVIAETGGSFREVYREFGSKEGLFLRAMQHLCQQIVGPWRNLNTRELPLEEALFTFGKSLLGTLLSPRLLALHRLILAEAVRFPELAQVWYRSGPRATSEALSEMLIARADADRLALTDSVVKATILIDSIVNKLQLQALVGVQVTQREADQHVRACVRVFLHGVSRCRPADKRRGKAENL